jgi:prepilin-type N-terminal cleavage/methylation domain-containing protein
MPASPATDLRRRGFTLVEVMVSMSVLVVLVFLYVGFFDEASRAWLTGSGNAERRRSARALTDYIAGELKSALLPVQTVDNTGKGNLQFIIDPPLSQVSTDYAYADSIFWQGPLATETTYGDLAEVGYFVQWDDTTPTAPCPKLCRFFVNPSTTDTTGNITPNANFLIFDPLPTRWLSTSLIKTVAPASQASGYLGLFGENVLGLWVRSYGLDGQELPRNYDSRAGYTCHFNSTDASGVTQNWTEMRYLPAKVQVSIAQIDSQNAHRLALAETQLKQLTNATTIRDAEGFLKAFRQATAGTPSLKPLLPGLRIYATEVQLSNAR